MFCKSFYWKISQLVCIIKTMLSFKNVSFIKDKNTILKDLSFTILPGECVGIVGASGAGKSSLFRLLTGEVRASVGTIALDDMALESFNLSSLQLYRRQIGIVFQDFRLLPKKSVFENVAFALEVSGQSNQISTIVPKLLDMVGLLHKADSFPKELSGGESQRVAIARAMAHNPKIIIADEATGNLDPKNAKEIALLLQKLNIEQGLTIIFSTHDPLLIDILKPRVIRLEKGNVLFDSKKCSLEKAFKGLR